MAALDALSIVFKRNAFYRDGYRLMLRVNVIQFSVVVLLFATIIGIILTVQTKHIYFATTPDGRIIPIVPLTDEYRSKAEVITWAAETAQQVMSFDHANYRSRLQQSSYSFTSNGWDSFNKALKDSKMLDAVIGRKLVVSMTVKAAPEIKRVGISGGRYNWILQFPVVIKYEGPESPQPIVTELELRVVRVSTLHSADGIQIEQWITK